jgi:hypothetical protein
VITKPTSTFPDSVYRADGARTAHVIGIVGAIAPSREDSILQERMLPAFS